MRNWRWLAVRRGMEDARRRATVGGYDSEWWSRDRGDGLHQQVRAVVGLWLSQLPLQRQHLPTRQPSTPPAREFRRPRPRRPLAMVEHDLYCCRLERHRDIQCGGHTGRAVPEGPRALAGTSGIRIILLPEYSVQFNVKRKRQILFSTFTTRASQWGVVYLFIVNFSCFSKFITFWHND